MRNSHRSGVSLRSIINDLVQRLVPGASARIGITQSQLNDKLYVKVEPSTEVNAFVEVSADRKTFQLVINDALMMFYHKLLKVYVGTLGVGNGPEDAIENPTIPFHEIVMTCKNLMQAFWDDEFLRTKSLGIDDLSPSQQELLSRLLMNCEAFDISHELGHVVIELENNHVKESQYANSKVVDFLNNIHELTSEDRAKIIGSWTDEICADLIGLDILLSQENSPPYSRWPHYKQWLAAGAEISNLLHMMLMEYNDYLTIGPKITLVSSHPHDYLRWKALSDSPTKAGIEDRLQFGRRFGHFSKEIMNELFLKTEDGGFVPNERYFGS